MALFLCRGLNIPSLVADLEERQKTLRYAGNLYVLYDSKDTKRHVIDPSQIDLVIKPYTLSFNQMLHTFVPRETGLLPLVDDDLVDDLVDAILSDDDVDKAQLYLLKELCKRFGGEVRLPQPYVELTSLYDRVRAAVTGKGYLLLGDALTAIDHGPENIIIYVAKPNLGTSIPPWITGLASTCNIYVYILHDDDNPSYDLFCRTESYYTAAGATVIDCKAIDDEFSSTELGSLSKSFYRASGEVVSEGDFLLGLSYGPESLSVVMRDFVKRFLAEGCASVGVAVSCRMLAQRIQEELVSQGVPCVNCALHPLSDTQCGKALVALLSYVMNPGKSTAWEVIDRFVSDKGAAHQKKLIKEFLATFNPTQAYLDKVIGELDGELSERIKELEELFYGHEALEPYEMWQQVFRKILDTVATPANEAIERKAARLYLQVAEKTCVHYGNLGISWDIESFYEKVRDLAFKVEPAEGAAVVIGTTRLVGSMSFDAVVFGDLAQETYPSYKAPGPLAHFLEEVGLPADEPFYLQKRYEFYNVITAAKKRLALVKQVTDRTGDELQSSLFLNEVLDLYASKDQTQLQEIPGQLRETGSVISLYDGDLAGVAPSLSDEVRTQRLRLAHGIEAGE